ncbi:bacillithiol biosynthesis deacetylase BshB1 [Deinococcus yavapaiensis]|uniref:Bacillithiol biosynthesis deacetylase BshB1 n=1 Tax=Deinococcus yavapaiensis KR-236 TaxID=694435 RepID=A0A318S4J1_9DEIO|nr:bacillithiol biosynthesis deacetylase BshB1 [Deinococcus yavapaiensis]PYE53503.1 bacillithiol biosynthesis deacetylase BshB1 [Deinococcus yavapaiensis KR-236]
MRTTFGEVRDLDALCLAPHPDDAEIGAGGTLIRLARDGRPAGILEMSRGEKGTLGTPDVREAECAVAAKIMGLAWRGQLELPDGELRDTQEGAAKLAATLRLVRPRVLFVPHHADRHPDHFGTYHLAKRGVHLAALAKADVAGAPHRVSSVLLYQGNAPIVPNVLVDVADVQDAWEAAIRAHASQFGGPYISETVTPEIVERRRARLTYWGTLAGRRYCEAFESEAPLLVEPRTLFGA